MNIILVVNKFGIKNALNSKYNYDTSKLNRKWKFLKVALSNSHFSFKTASFRDSQGYKAYCCS